MSFHFLISGYEVSCYAAGFKTEVLRDVPLELYQKTRLDFLLHMENPGDWRQLDCRLNYRTVKPAARSVVCLAI